MTTYIDYGPSPLHQGSRSRTGDQVDRHFVHDLLAVLGDCRLLWLPNLTDAMTSTERSRRAGTITWSESLASWDTARSRLGSGIAVAFNGTDEEGEVPDADRLRFGAGTADEGFSVGMLIKPDVNNVTMRLLAKQNSATAEEWVVGLDSLGRPFFQLTDESASATLERSDPTPIGTDWVLLICTYDGSGAQTGMRIYVNAVRVDDTDGSVGSYTAMENTTADVHLGARDTAGVNFFDGGMAVVFITGKVLGAGDVWAVKELANAYFGRSL